MDNINKTIYEIVAESDSNRITVFTNHLKIDGFVYLTWQIEEIEYLFIRSFFLYSSSRLKKRDEERWLILERE